MAYFLSGVLFWPTPAEGWNVPAGAVYSLLYNGSYTILTLPICSIIILLIYKRAPQLIEPELKEISNEK